MNDSIRDKIEKIMQMKKTWQQRRATVQKDLDSFDALLKQTQQEQYNAKDAEEFQQAYEKIQEIKEARSRKQKELHPATSDDAIFRAWDEYAEDYAADIGNALTKYKAAKRSLYEMFVSIAEMQNECLMVRNDLSEMLSCDKSYLKIPVKVPEYGRSAARFFDDVIRKGDYYETVLQSITVWETPDNLSERLTRTKYNGNQERPYWQ